jgi:hypothetical protein
MHPEDRVASEMIEGFSPARSSELSLSTVSSGHDLAPGSAAAARIREGREDVAHHSRPPGPDGGAAAGIEPRRQRVGHSPRVADVSSRWGVGGWGVLCNAKYNSVHVGRGFRYGDRWCGIGRDGRVLLAPWSFCFFEELTVFFFFFFFFFVVFLFFFFFVFLPPLTLVLPSGLRWLPMLHTHYCGIRCDFQLVCVWLGVTFLLTTLHDPIIFFYLASFLGPVPIESREGRAPVDVSACPEPCVADARRAAVRRMRHRGRDDTV